MIFKTNVDDREFGRRVKAFYMFPFLMVLINQLYPITRPDTNKFNAYFEFPKTITVRRSYDKKTDTYIDYDVMEIINCNYYTRKNVSVTTDPLTGANVHVDEIHTEKHDTEKASAILVTTIVKVGNEVKERRIDFYTDYLENDAEKI